MPKELSFRLRYLSSKYHAQYIWDNKMTVPIPTPVRKSLQTIYKYVHSHQPWEQPIGHIVPRVPAFVATSDASTKAIGVHIPTIRAWCLIPFSAKLCNRISTNDVHINALEFVALLITYIMVQEKHAENPARYPPHPTLDSRGDNTSANAWWRKMSTQSTMGQNLVKLYAEYQLQSPVCSLATHIAGKLNVFADGISRPHELFTPHLTHIHSTPFPTLVTQVCQQFRECRRWDLFLPSATLTSALNSALCSDSSWERPKKPTNNGHFVAVGSTFFNGQPPKECFRSCFL